LYDPDKGGEYLYFKGVKKAGNVNGHCATMCGQDSLFARSKTSDFCKVSGENDDGRNVT
jgi:hypothetical protein